MSQDQEPAWQGPDNAVPPHLAAFDTQLGDLVAYCRTVTRQDEDSVRIAHDVLESAQSLLTDPDKLRAWLFGLARTEILPASAPQAREVFDLIHRRGVRPEDLPLVLRISPVEADELLAAAEEDVGWDDRVGYLDDTSYLSEGQPDPPFFESTGEMFEAQLPGLVAYCRALTGRQDDAVDTAHTVLHSAQSLLSDPDRLRAWLFGLARREMHGAAAPSAQEVIELVHRHAVRAEDLPAVLGIAPIDADELLAAAEEEYASSAFGFGPRDADSRQGEGSDDDKSWHDRADWDDGADWDEAFGPKRHRLQDLYGLFRKPPESAGRHAAPGLGAGLRQALTRGPVRAAAAAGIVVAVIGVSTAYLAASSNPPPSHAGQQTKHRPPAVVPIPAMKSSPAPTDTPTGTTNQPVTAVLPPPPPASAPTSPRPTSPSAAPSPSSPSSSSSSSPSPTPTPSPDPT